MGEWGAPLAMQVLRRLPTVPSVKHHSKTTSRCSSRWVPPWLQDWLEKRGG